MEYLNNIQFIKSVFDIKDLPHDDLPVICMIGKSNVGKSSIINGISNNSKIAKVSSTPGKTKSLNVYMVNNELYLIDFPGYGFSSMNNFEQQKADKVANSFLETSNNIKHILYILDARHTPSKDDIQMYQWLKSKNFAFSIVLNKIDKLSKTQLELAQKNILTSLNATQCICISAYKKQNIEYIIHTIKDAII